MTAPKKKKAPKKRAKKKKAAKKKASQSKKARTSRGKNSRSKGKKGERAAVNALKRLWPDRGEEERVWRNYQDRGAEREGPDVETPHLDVEVKRRKVTSIPMAIRSAKEAVRPGRRWAAIDHPDRKQPTITMDLEEFIEFVLDERMRAHSRGWAQRDTEGAES